MEQMLVCIQVRLKSKRCKKKAMALLAGEPLIIRLSNRLLLSNYASRNNIVWCTSTNSEDDPLCALAANHGFKYYRGSEKNVAKRFLGAVSVHSPEAETIIRVTGDNPLTDPGMMDILYQTHLSKRSDYTYPDNIPTGIKSEVISVSALRDVERRMVKKHSYLTYELMKLKNKQKVSFVYGAAHYGTDFTVDTEQDMNNIKLLFDYYRGAPPVLFAHKNI